MSGRNNKFPSNLNNNCEEYRSITVPYTNSYLLSPLSSKVSASTKIQHKSDTTINAAPYKNIGNKIQIENNGRKLKKSNRTD